MMARALPFVSIIIPTHNRPQQLQQCLESLTRLDYPGDSFEVIVVDDGSALPLGDVLLAFAGRLPLRWFVQTNGGPGSARNAGADHARGDYLAFVDDDCEPAPDWLSALAAEIVRHPDCMVGGRTVNRLRRNPYSAASQVVIDIVYAHFNARPEEATFFASNNMALPLAAFRAIGGFKTDVRMPASEDRELCDRWLSRGYRMIYVPEAVSFHAHALSFWTYCKQHFTYGRGAVQFHRLRARRGFGSVLEAIKFHANLKNWLLFPTVQTTDQRRLTIMALLVLWQLANAAGIVSESARLLLNPRLLPQPDAA